MTPQWGQQNRQILEHLDLIQFGDPRDSVILGLLSKLLLRPGDLWQNVADARVDPWLPRQDPLVRIAQHSEANKSVLVNLYYLFPIVCVEGNWIAGVPLQLNLTGDVTTSRATVVPVRVITSTRISIPDETKYHNLGGCAALKLLNLSIGFL